ncbi:heterokaryon incompatibility protein [Rutstroemia sp. NJR-2017a BBW]|nr:heterokaryon incompatibility protein [Rutstroemia sp. NJR-2017a BBW]
MTLLPGQTHEEIKVVLSVVSLSTNPQYEALSYVWGDAHSTRFIFIDGCSSRITENLEVALRWLRHVDRERVLWVDAICVNQQDLAERESQVSLMAEIYGGCQFCTVWLGEEDASTERAFDLLRSMASGSHFEDWSCFPLEFLQSLKLYRESKKELEACILSYSGLLEPSQDLFKRSWWSRSWTVQELIFSKLVTVKCGRHEIDWDQLSQAHSTLEIHLERCCAHFRDYLSGVDDTSLHIFDVAVSALNELRLGYQEEKQPGAGRHSMVYILALNRKRKASDPRDKVYAFLSLCPVDVRETLRADYDADLVDCYAWPTINDIRKSRSLGALSHALRYEECAHLPSWVSDWSILEDENDPLGNRMEIYDLFDAAKGSAAIFSRKGRTLSLWGSHRQTILAVRESISFGTHDDTISVLQSWFDLWRHLIQKPGASSDSAIPFLRTLMLDTFRPFEQDERRSDLIVGLMRARPQDYEACQRWWTLACVKEAFAPDLNMEPGLETSLMRSLRQNIDLSVGHQLFFITEEGSIGLGPRTTRVGDEIWIACGGNMPLILRPAESSNSSHPYGQPRCTLVGDCYIDGFMDGEAADGLENDGIEVRIV